MARFVTILKGGPMDGGQVATETAPRDGDVRYVPIHAGCLLPGQSVATERRHVYRFHWGRCMWIYQGVE